ncbi:MAG: 7-cyano-7-deazaguanine synthase [Aquificaceae bacterium]|nr:7-cyano-7-deazaguanine synthase [Aquificaceae bacterium]
MWPVSARKVVVLFSGGIESTCLLYLFLMDGWLAYPIYIRSGYPWELFELENAKSLWLYTKKLYRNAMPMRIIPYLNPEPADSRKHEKDLYIPLRNLSLLTSASIYALLKGVGHVAIGSLGLYPFPDNNPEYMQNLQKLIEVKLLTPFMGLHKHEVIRRFFNKVPLEKTLSCIKPKKHRDKIIPCGSCEKCKEREEAFKTLSL